MIRVWDFVEKYYPNYTTSYEIAYADDLAKILDDEFDNDSHSAEIFNETKQEILSNNGFCEDFMVMDEVKKMLQIVEARIYEKSIKEYLKNENI